MNSARLVLLSLVAGFLVLASAGLTACGSSGGQMSQSDRDKAVDEAQTVYRQFIATGQPTGPGPCISESLPGLPDWVADIAHSPRLPLDDQPQNECQRYRAGQAHHFVELDENGTLIRAQ